MNEVVRIRVESRSDPQLRKLARALLSLVQRQSEISSVSPTMSSTTSRSTGPTSKTTSSGDSR